MQGIFSSVTSRKSFKERAQAIAEFAIVLPILMMILVGILEAGRMVFIYAAINNASREAARYASAAGLNDAGAIEKYKDCAGIEERARRSAFFTTLTVTIAYDHGTTASTFDTCDGATDSAVVVNSGTNVDRATITVSANYKPMVKLLPLPTRTITSMSSRTILGILELAYP